MEETSEKVTAAPRPEPVARRGQAHVSRQALARRLQGRAADGPMPRRRAGEAAPLSHAQERLWFLDQLEPGSAAYNIARAFTCRGRLDAAALAASLTGVAARHEALRTTFAVRDGRPCQVVAGPAPVPLPAADLAALPAAAREPELERLGAREAARAFDLARGPLLRATLVRLQEEEHALLLTLHHAVADGWSLQILVHELGALYEAITGGRPAPLPELAVQYADWAAWQRERLSGEVLDRLLGYWREQLAGAPHLLELPLDRPRPAVQTSRGARRAARLPEPLARALRDLGGREGATPFMTLLAGVAALLGRWAGQEDLVVGSPIAGRLSSEVEPLIGFFANVLPLRVRLAGEPSTRELVGRVRRVCLDAYAHQELPLERLVEELNPERSLAWTPLFQVTFALQEAPPAALLLPRLVIEQREVAREQAKFDLSLDAVEVDGGIELDLWYNTDLFEATTAASLLGSLATLLAAAAEAPGRRVSELPLLSSPERRQVLASWNATATPYPREASIDGLFAAVAAADPGAVAVEQGGRRVTYRELARRANRLARHLRALGLGPEAAVGLGLERSVESVVGMLGALAAGGCYVPLDPAYPRERLAWMLADAGVEALVVRGGSSPGDGADHGALVEEARRHGCPVVDLDRDAEVLASYPDGPLASRSPPEALAYVMYTSGSTGVPKGVAVPHRAVVRLVRETWYAGFGRDEVFLHAAPTSFDAATLEVWGPLLNGGRLAVLPGARPALAEIGEAVAQHGVTALWLTAGLFHQMLDEHPQGLAPLRRLLAGGDVLSPAHVRRALERLPGCVLVNGYGPTENTTFTCCRELRSPAELTSDAVPIGRPIANTRVYVVDRHLQPVPVGVAGELLAGGDGLARGYLGRPAATAERFVPDPFGAPSDGAWSTPGSRLYKTGDLVRWRPGGDLEFLGRLDGQVKVRGFRIEPGEIEAALAAHPRVGRAVVATRPGPGGDKRLVAWIVPAGDPAREGLVDELRRHLAARLPEHMVPSAFVLLDELPLTPNGKVDRGALPEPAAGTVREGSRAPRTPTEELLAGAWCDLLEVERVGLDDDFFALGGHSLLATRLVSRLRGLFGLDLPLRALFEAPTVEALAAVVDAARRAGGDDGEVPLLPRPRQQGEPLPLSFAQERLWFLDQLEPGGSAYNVPLALTASGRLDVAALAAALAEVARRHEVLRTTYGAGEDGAPAQRVGPCPDRSAWPLPAVDLSGLPPAAAGPEADRLAGAEARGPFDLARGPVFRAALLRLAAREHLLGLGLHHIACDGWSLGVLFAELATLYGAFAAGRPSPLADLSLQYADWAVWQRERLAGTALAAELAWWRERLAGAPAALELPVDRPRPATPSDRGGHRSQVVPEELARAVASLARREGATPFMVMLAAFQGLLSRLCGADDLCVGTPVAGRTRPEVEGLVGFFVNTLVLRADLADDPSFDVLLTRAREACLDAWAHQELPFERLVEALAPERRFGRTPLVQVLFSLDQTTAGRAPDLPGLRLSRRAVDTGTSKFDLSLALEDGPSGLAATAVYSADLFDGTTAARLLGCFLTLLTAAVATPERRVAELPLLSLPERGQLLGVWNATTTASPREATVDGLFAAVAAAHPDATAIAQGDERVSYGELARRAGRLAHRLRALGACPETAVGLALERSADLVASMLGTLAAGGCYVPLDPSSPRQRLAWTLSDARVAVLVTRGDSAAADSGEGAVEEARRLGIPIVDLERDALLLASGLDEAPRPSSSPDGLAYVMYTSGSTGVPKGVAVPHRAVVRLVRETWYARFARDEVFLHLAPPAFDASTLEVWGPLLNGGTLAVLPGAKPTLAEIGEAVARHGVTTLWLTAGLFHQMVDEHPEALRPLRRLLAGGDVLSPPHVRRALELLPGCTLVNGYGPTENTTFTCCRELRSAAEVGATVPIGRPIANTRVYVVDRRGEPLPVGVPGELLAGGDGLARGYLGRPELTAERFVPDPFGEMFEGSFSEPGSRLYRTGDLVRWLPGGELEFLGRLDGQVKVRGFRIEPGEVEAALASHPGVERAAVAARPGPGGDKRLVAWVVPAAAPAAADLGAELRRHLAARLPEQMVPSVFVTLAELPLTANGKVDRRALPQPAQEAEREGSGELRTPTEELVAGVWCDVLGVARAGRDDDFFASGGHSLIATRLVSRLRALLGVELPLRRLFELRTVFGLAAEVDGLRASGGRDATPPLVPVPRDRDLPLSFAQERLWFLDRLEPLGSAYNVPLALRAAGPLAAGALAAALAEIARRHEALRTAFAAGRDGPRQRIAPPAPAALPAVDLSALPEGARAGEAARLARAAARRPFDLATGPLARTALVRLDAELHDLLATFHHAVFDGWSIGVWLRELAALYGAALAARPSPLPPLAVQYADHAAWQRGRLAGEALARRLAWWRERLADLPPVLELPTDRPRPAAQSFRGGRAALALTPTLSDHIGRLGRQHGATLFMTLLAAFQLVLSRWTGRDEPPVGSPVAGRTRAETEGLIGLFVNTLVLRTDLSGDPSFADALGRAREVCLGAYAHQDLPFEKLVEELRPARDLATTPLVQVMLILQEPPARAALPGLAVELSEVDDGTAKLDLTLAVHRGEEGLAIQAGFAADLFDRATIERLLGHLRALLEGAVEEPERCASELPLLTPAERAELAAWNATAAPYDPDLPVHRLIEGMARRTPQAVALVLEPGMNPGGAAPELTYGELDRRVRRLARRLVGLGLRPESLVAVAVERGADLAVAPLAVLAAGGAYVPLDPAHPRQRLAAILDDARPAALLTRAPLLPDLPEPPCPVLLLDDDVEGEGEPPTPEEPEEPAAAGDDRPQAWAERLAYTIFTSGSTGRPKGVQITHRALVNLLRSMAREHGLRQGDVLLAVTTLSFDIAGVELLLPLTIGARVAVAGRDTAADGRRLAERLAAVGATVLQATPATWRLLLDAGWPGEPRLTAICGGEAMPPDFTTALAPRVGVLWNSYGPTETTIWSTARRVEPGEAPVRIGGPIANTALWVLGRGGSLLPVGVPGELAIGGDGLARGYLGRPDLTAERFVPDPFGDRPGARLYRTGDLVRRRPDGDLDFLGRIDHQVKIRGFRIELGEIEHALARCPGVARAVVLAREDRPGDRRLVAYVVAAPLVAPPDPAELRAALRARLTDSMIPAAFVLLPELPLNPNGKVDRKALPAPEAHPGEAAPEPPGTALERLLATLWAEVLGLPDDRPVGRADDFFELGGHSLLATRVVAGLRERSRLEVPVRTLFEAPTLAALAARLERLGEGAGSGWSIPTTRRREAPLSFAQERLWFLDRLEPGPTWNVPFSLRLEGRLELPALAAALAEIARRHAVLRATFAERDGIPEQRTGETAPGPLPLVDLGGLAGLAGLAGLPGSARGNEVLRLQRAEAWRRFDLTRGPLHRAMSIRLGVEEHLLVVTVHHIAVDGWSLGVLCRELAALYPAALERRPSPLPEPRIQYADFAAWQRGWLAGPLLAGKVAWWRERLADLPPVLELPADRPRPAVRGTRGGLAAVHLPLELALASAGLARRRGASLFMLLLTTFQVLLSRWTGRDEPPVGSPVAGRTRSEVEGLIGLFVNALVLRTDLSGDPSFTDALGRAREVCLGAYAHQDLPFEKLVEELRPARDLATTPLVQVMLILQNAAGTVPALPGLAVSRAPLGEAPVRLDITLAFEESAEGLEAEASFAADLFDRATIERLLGHLRALLEGAVAEPERRASELPLLTATERAELAAWNATATAYDPDLPVHRLVELAARRAPQAAALVLEPGMNPEDGGVELTYGELDRRVRRLARRLAGLGLGPEALVAVAVERGPDLVVAPLAVLAAGGAYVPLDPAHPRQRLAAILDDARPAVLLTRTPLVPGLPEPPCPILLLDEEPSDERAAPAEPDEVMKVPSGEALAYTIFTSGSTGRPKGVQITHRAFANFLRSMAREPGLGAEDVLLAVTTPSFDIAGLELLLPLTVGGRVALASRDTAADPARLAERLAAAGATVLQATPATWRLLLDDGWPGDGRLKALCGGEALPTELAARLAEKVGELWNVYGPTETTVWSAARRVRSGEAPVVVGGPIANTSLWVVDRRFEPSPVGVPGELAIGGHGLARGYLGRPDLTAERFVPDPFAGEPGARLYRTGDLVRRRPDGDLEFLGRIDHQVKIRGFRIELGEIEAALARCPGVGRAVVVAREDRPGERRLVAYLVAASGAAPDPTGLRAALRERLPDSMIPAAFVLVAELPLTPSGKVDRKALPAPEATAAGGEGYVPPRTPIEEVLAAIWSEVLGIERIGARDDFFDLGGHSLLAARVASRVRQSLLLELPLRSLFQHPRLEGLAGVVEELLAAEDATG